MLQPSERSGSFSRIPIENAKHEVQIYLKQGEITYRFLCIKQSHDGSIECIFYNLNSTRKGISQEVEYAISAQAGGKARIISETTYDALSTIDPHITYHTTGRVNYHGFSFEEQFFTPLDRIDTPQFFFMISFCRMDTFQEATPSCVAKRPGVILDISEFNNKRCDMLFAIVPKTSPNAESFDLTCLVIDYALFGIQLVILDDITSFNLSSVYNDSETVKFKPHQGNYQKQLLTINEAYLGYQHKLYETKDLIILPPNGEGIIRMIFPVEMRRPPWVRLEFEDKNLIIDQESIRRKQTNILFKIKDSTSGHFVKDAKRIRIQSIVLDAEIYEDESHPPIGYI